MKIISWQSLLTDHQYFTWQAMQQRGHEISFILARVNDEEREKQGWTNSQFAEIPQTILPQNEWWKAGKELIDKNRDAIHVFGGFWADKRFFPIILYSLFHNVKTAVMNESYAEVRSGYQSDENIIKLSLKKFLRPLLYWMAASLINLKARKFCLLAISILAEKQFRAAGLKKEQVFPFGYFVPKQEIKSNEHGQNRPLRIVYVGTLIKRKGIDFLINAVEEINQLPNSLISLDIFGYGDIQKWLPEPVPGISYKGTIPFGHTQEVVTNYDYLVLPSRHDGWGVVVNEALLQGVPVILSDQVGAKALVERSGAGLLFESENVDDLKKLLLSLAADPQRQAQYADKASQMAAKINPAAAAIYLEDILNFYYFSIGQRPIPNWER